MKPATKADSTLRSSRAVPHPSTNRTLRRLTSEVGRDPVHSTRYGRRRYERSAGSKIQKEQGGWQATLSQARPAQAEVSQAGSGRPGQARESAKSSGIHFSHRIDWADMTMGYRNIIAHHVFSNSSEFDTCGIRTHAGRPHWLSRPTP